jgi:hypothetical protein
MASDTTLSSASGREAGQPRMSTSKKIVINVAVLAVLGAVTGVGLAGRAGRQQLFVGACQATARVPAQTQASSTECQRNRRAFL